MPLTSKDHCCKVLKGFQQLRKDAALCDYNLVANGQVIHVHKAVMAASSDYFYAMLTGNMKESHENEVILKGVTAAGLQAIVDFAYTGVLNLTSNNVHEVLTAASHLQVIDAIDLCSTYLKMAINVENCVDILNLSEMYSLTSAYERTRKFMLENFELIAMSDHYNRLTHTQLASLLSENSLRVMSEYHVFKLVLQWINYNITEREERVAELMKNVRLPLLTGEELVDKVSDVELMRCNESCRDLLTEAKDYHIVVSKQPQLQSSQTQVRSDKKSLVLCHAENLESFTLETKRHSFLKEANTMLYNPCVAVVDNFMYVCGGKYDRNENNDIATARCFRYDPRFDSWYELTAMNEARKDFVMIPVGKNLYTVAGQDENKVMCTVECFSIVNNEWDVKSPLSYSVSGHAGATYCGKIYVSGGQIFSGCCNNMSVYDPGSDAWEERTPMLQGRCNHIMAEVLRKIYVLGGNVEDSYGFADPVISIERYCPLNDQWTHCKGTLNIREAGGCVLDNKIYIVGGINEHYYSDMVQEYDPEKETVTIVEQFPARIYGRACCILTLPFCMCV